MIPIMEIKPQGFDALSKRFFDAGNVLISARESALKSTGNMIRNAVKMAAFQPNGEYGLGWPKLSPFTRTINLARGEKRGAFAWAKEQIQDFGGGSRGAKAAHDYYLAKEGKAANLALRGRFEQKYGPLTGKSRAGGFTRTFKAAWQQVKTDEDYARYATTGRASALRRMVRGLLGKKNKRVGVKTYDMGTPLSRIAGMARYAVEKMVGKVTIGFSQTQRDWAPDPAIERLVELQARGFTTTITSKMRRFLFAAGFPTSATSLVTPARQWISKVREKIASKVGEHFRTKFFSKFMPAMRRGGYQQAEAEAA